MRTTTLTEFLTIDQLAEVIRLWERPHCRGTFHADVLREIVEPNMPEINRKLGQQNSAAFIAYAIEHVLCETVGEPVGGYSDVADWIKDNPNDGGGRPS